MSIFVGDRKVAIELEFRDYDDTNGTPTDVGPINLTLTEEVTFIFQKPDGSMATSKKKSEDKVVYTTNGTDGKALYETEVDFIDMAGTWRVQGLVDLASDGGSFHSEIVTFEVEAPLPR